MFEIANSPLRSKVPAVTFVAPDGETSGGAVVAPVAVPGLATAIPQLEVVDLWPAGTLLVSFTSPICPPKQEILIDFCKQTEMTGRLHSTLHRTHCLPRQFQRLLPPAHHFPVRSLLESTYVVLRMGHGIQSTGECTEEWKFVGGYFYYERGNKSGSDCEWICRGGGRAY